MSFSLIFSLIKVYEPTTNEEERIKIPSVAKWSHSDKMLKHNTFQMQKLSEGKNLFCSLSYRDRTNTPRVT